MNHELKLESINNFLIFFYRRDSIGLFRLYDQNICKLGYCPNKEPHLIDLKEVLIINTVRLSILKLPISLFIVRKEVRLSVERQFWRYKNLQLFVHVRLCTENGPSNTFNISTLRSEPISPRSGATDYVQEEQSSPSLHVKVISIG